MVGCSLPGRRSAPLAPVSRRWRETEVEVLVAAEPARRRGVGRRSMALAGPWAVELGIDRVRPTIHEFNAEAGEFYRRLGYGTEQRAMSRRVGSRPEPGDGSGPR